MQFLDLLVWVAGIGGFGLLTACLAASLYYLAELVEEYTVLTRKVIRWSIMTIVGAHVALWIFDGFPWMQVLFSMGAHAFYTLLLKEFPFIELTSPTFIMSCVLTLVNHFLWFTYFSNTYYRFTQVASFFTLCVWLVPFMFFVSLSASDNTLPSVDSSVTENQRRNRIGNRVLSLFHLYMNKKDSLLPATVQRSKDF